MNPIRILLVDDHAVVREGLRLMLDAQPGLHVVAEAADGASAIRLAQQVAPDLILLDLLMPGMDGVAVIRALRAAGVPSRVLVLTSTLEDRLVRQSVEAGAAGYVLKAGHTDDLIRAVERVDAGEHVLDPAALQKVVRGLHRPADPLYELTDREREVFAFVARGQNNREIAQALVVSENTVRSHIANLLDKLDLRDRVQVMVFALKRGLVRPDDLP